MLQINIKAKRVKLTFLFGLLMLVNYATWFVTATNQKAGLYPIDADSIGIPIMLTNVICLLMLPVLLAICGLTNKNMLIGLKSKGHVIRLVVKINLVLLYSIPIALASYGLSYWSHPGHYLIAASYAILLVVFLGYLVVDWLEINKALKG